MWGDMGSIWATPWLWPAIPFLMVSNWRSDRKFKRQLAIGRVETNESRASLGLEPLPNPWEKHLPRRMKNRAT